MLITNSSVGSYIRMCRLLGVQLTDNHTDLCGGDQ
jgi:hypothetical protein